MSAHRSDMPKSRLEGYGTLLPSKCKEIYEHIEVESFDDRPQSGKAAVGVPDQILGETLRIARLRIKELEAETNIQTTELNRLKEYVNASESAGRTMYGQQVDELKQTVAQNVAQLDYMRHAMKTKDGEIEVLKKKWQEYQEVQDRLSGYEKDRLGEKDLLRKRAEQIDALQHKVSSYEQHLSEAQAASFQALQDQLHSFQNEMAAAALLRTQLVDKDRQIDTARQMYNDEAGRSQSLMQQWQQANEATAAAEAETRRALERVEAARTEAREVNMASMRLKDELTQSRQEAKDLLIDNARTRALAAKDKAAAAEAKDSEEDMQANIAKLQKQIEKSVAERNAAEGRSQRSAASLLKVKADLAALEIKFQAKSEEVSHVQATWEHHENSMIEAQLQLADLKVLLEASEKAEAEAKAAKEAAEAQLMTQNSELGRIRSRMAGAEAEMDELRSQVSKAVAAHESVSEQLSDTERALTERSEQLTNATATLEAREADLSKLSQQHQALILQHERTEGELSDLTNVLKTKQKDNMALQQGLEAAQVQEQQGRALCAQLETDLVGFKDRIRVAEGELAKNAPIIAHLNHSNQNMGNRITALEQLRTEMQEELFQQSVEATQLHSANQLLTAHLAKAEDKSSALQASITALNDDKLKVQLESQVYESTLQKMNLQLESSLGIMAGEKAALQLSLTALQEQFEGVAQAVYSADDSVVDDELDRMRQQMAETASLLASAAYAQPQVQLQHYQAKLTEHLADPSQPLNLDIEGTSAERQPERQGEGQELSGQRAGVQFSGLVETPPRTPGQDAAGRAARAKRVASSREMAAQMRQLEGRLMALREELREKEGKARHAEHSVQDLKLQLEDLQMQTVSDHDVHDQEIETLGRKLTEAEREAAAANEKAEKLHEQLHGSTFHIKLAKEAMKKVREAEAAVQAKLAEEAEALRQEALDRHAVGDVEDKETQTEPTSKPGSPATPRRPMPTSRDVIRQEPRPTPRQAPRPTPRPTPSQEPKPTPRQPPAPRPQPQVVKREPRPVAQTKTPAPMHVATAAGDEVAQSLPQAAAAHLPPAHPFLPPKRQWQKSMREIHVPTTLLKRRGPAAESSFSSEELSADAPEAASAAVTDAASAAADPVSTLTEAESSTMPSAEVASSSVEVATSSAQVASPSTSAVTVTAAAPSSGSVQSNIPAVLPASPQLAISTAGNHAPSTAGKGSGSLRPPPSTHSTSSTVISNKAGAADRGNAAANAAGLSMLGHSNTQQSKKSTTASQPKPESPAVPAIVLPVNEQQPVQTADQPGPTPVAGPAPVAATSLPNAYTVLVARQPDREVLTIGEGGELRPLTALTEDSTGTASSRAPSQLDTPMPNQATGEVPFSLPAALASRESPTVPEMPQGKPAASELQELRMPSSAQAAGDTPASRASTADRTEPTMPAQHEAQTEAEYAVQVHHAAAGRLHRNRAHTRPQSPLQSQISSVHGSNPNLQTGDQPQAIGSAKSAQRAQHAPHNGQQSKVPPLNMAVMRALKQQVSGLVPLSSSGISKAARAVLQQTASASQRSLSTRQSLAAGLPSKAEDHAQLTPVSTNAIHSRSLPDLSPLTTARSPTVQAGTLLPIHAASQSQPMLPHGVLPMANPRQILSLDDTVQLICDMYDSKAVADLAALRQQAPCRPMQEFVQQYLQRRYGTGAGGSWLEAWQQLETAVKMHAIDARVAAFATSCGLLQAADVPSSAQVLYNGSQPLTALPTTTAWAAAWLGDLNAHMQLPADPAPLRKLSMDSRAKLMSASSLHPAVAEVLRGLAVVPGMHYVLQCTHGTAYANILAQADLGIPLGPQQAPQLHKLLADAAEALQLERPPQLFLQHSPQAAMHYMEMPVASRLPGLAAPHIRQRRGRVSLASVKQQQGADCESAAAMQQPAVVVTSRIVELLQPDELQAVFVGTLITGLASGNARQPSAEGQVAASSPTVQQVALAASLASLCGAALAEEVGDELGMLWPTRVQPALLRALPYLSLYSDRWAVQVMPQAEVVSSAILKVAAGTPLLAGSLNPNALLTESAALQGVLDSKLNTLLRQESGHTFTAANNSLTVLRLREAQRH